MRKLLKTYSQTTLVVAVTVLSIIGTLLIIFIAYKIIGVEIRKSEIVVGSIAPLIIASSMTWYLIGLLLKLDKLETEMRGYANYDDLTGLMSRRGFMEAASSYFSIAGRYGRQLGLTMVDIDHFKILNDTYGHVAGDMVLNNFGRIVNRMKRKSDLACRFGGEEFLFLLPETNLEGSQSFADSLHKEISETMLNIHGQVIVYTVSIGVTILDASSKIVTIDELIERTDKALYEAKQTGRNKTVIFKDNL